MSEPPIDYVAMIVAGETVLVLILALALYLRRTR